MALLCTRFACREGSITLDMYLGITGLTDMFVFPRASCQLGAGTSAIGNEKLAI